MAKAPSPTQTWLMPGEEGWFYSYFLPPPEFLFQLFGIPSTFVGLLKWIEREESVQLIGVRPSDSAIPHIVAGRAKPNTEAALWRYLSPITDQLPTEIFEGQPASRRFNYWRWPVFLAGLGEYLAQAPELARVKEFIHIRVHEEQRLKTAFEKLGASSRSASDKQREAEYELFSRFVLPEEFAELVSHAESLLSRAKQLHVTRDTVRRLELTVQLDFVLSLLAHLELGVVEYLEEQTSRRRDWVYDHGELGMMHWLLPSGDKNGSTTPFCRFLDGLRSRFGALKTPISWSRLSGCVPVSEDVIARGNADSNRKMTMKEWRKNKTLPSIDRLEGLIAGLVGHPAERNCLLALGSTSVALTRLYRHQVRSLREGGLEAPEQFIASAYRHYSVHRTIAFSGRG